MNNELKVALQYLRNASHGDYVMVGLEPFTLAELADSIEAHLVAKPQFTGNATEYLATVRDSDVAVAGQPDGSMVVVAGNLEVPAATFEQAMAIIELDNRPTRFPIPGYDDETLRGIARCLHATNDRIQESEGGAFIDAYLALPANQRIKDLMDERDHLMKDLEKTRDLLNEWREKCQWITSSPIFEKCEAGHRADMMSDTIHKLYANQVTSMADAKRLRGLLEMAGYDDEGDKSKIDIWWDDALGTTTVRFGVTLMSPHRFHGATPRAAMDAVLDALEIGKAAAPTLRPGGVAGMQPGEVPVILQPGRELPPIGQHDCYKDGDANIPEQICDQNGQVELAQCKRCGLAEIELVEQPVCTAPASRLMQ